MKKRMIIPSLFVLAALAAGLVHLAGGDAGNSSRFSGESKRVAQVVDRLAEASRDGDGDRVCNDLFTANLRISVTRASGASCAEQVTKSIGSQDAAFDIRTVRTKGPSARVVVLDDQRRASAVYLQRSKSGWRIAAVSPAS
jgi:hypothetical protein